MKLKASTILFNDRLSYRKKMSLGKLSHVYDNDQAKRGHNQASFVKFNMKAVELQSQELKKLRDQGGNNSIDK